MANRVNKIRQHNQLTWDHVSTTHNPADKGSGGANIVHALWRKDTSIVVEQPIQVPPDKLATRTSNQSRSQSDIFDPLLVCLTDTSPLSYYERGVDTPVHYQLQETTRRKESWSNHSGPIKTCEIEQKCGRYDWSKKKPKETSIFKPIQYNLTFSQTTTKY